MSGDIDGALPVKVYTTADGRTAIEQSTETVILSAEQIIKVIRELHVCYDYCASWKEPTRE